MDPSDVTLAILAGGRGTRMGQAKSGLTLNNKPILGHLFERLAWPGPTLLITAPGNENPPGSDLFTRELTDPVADQGPLRGVLTAIDGAATEVLAIVTVDMPNVEARHLQWLMEQLADAEAVMCRRQSQIEPFPLVIKRGVRHSIAQRLADGNRSVHALSEDRATRLVDPDWSAEVWTNLNRPQDLADYLKRQTTS